MDDQRLFLGCEEALLAVDLMSAGWRMAYVPQAIVHHDPSHARDVAARRRLALRNALWLAWLRRPWAARDRRDAKLARRKRARWRASSQRARCVPRRGRLMRQFRTKG